MKWHRAGRHPVLFILSFLLIFSLFTGLAVSAAVISTGGTGYVNMQQYCTPGKSTSSGSYTSGSTYVYDTFEGGRTYLRMMYLSDSNAAGAAKRTDEKGNVIWAYCVEYGTAIESYNSRTAGSLTGSSAWKSLSADQQLGITLATMYGCPISKLETSVSDSYAATQALIWEYQTGIRTSVTEDSRKTVTYRGKTIESTRFTDMLSGKAGMTAYNALVKQVLAHRTVPSFAGSTITLQYDTGTKTYCASVLDTNAVLENYDLSCDNPAVTLTRSGNTLTLTSSQYVKDVTLSMKRQVPELTGQALLALTASGSGQSTIVGQNSDQTTATADVLAEINSEKYKISVYKQGEMLTGFTEETVELADGQRMSKAVPVYEKAYLNDCELQLVAAEDIVTEDGTVQAKTGEVVDTLTTSSEGPVSSKELYPGHYMLRETDAPEGYRLLSEGVPVNLEQVDQTITVQDDRLKASLQFTKQLELSEEGVVDDTLFSQVAFGVYTSDPILNLPADTLLDVIIPGTDGSCTLGADLPYGYHYYLKELSTAEHYLLDESSYTFAFVSAEPLSINGGEAVVNHRETTTQPTTTSTTTTTTTTTTEPSTTAPTTTVTTAPTTTNTTVNYTEPIIVRVPDTDDPTHLLPVLVGVVICLGGLLIFRRLNQASEG